MTKGMNGKIREEIKALEKYLTSLDKVMRQHDKELAAIYRKIEKVAEEHYLVCAKIQSLNLALFIKEARKEGRKVTAEDFFKGVHGAPVESKPKAPEKGGVKIKEVKELPLDLREW